MMYFAQSKIKFGSLFKPIDIIETTTESLTTLGGPTAGLWDSEKRAIHVALDDFATPEFILMHELVHAIDTLYETTETAEAKADLFGAILLSLIRENKDLIFQLIGQHYAEDSIYK